MSQKTLSTEKGFTEIGDIAKLSKTDKSAAEHATSFDPPIYNVWKQQKKSEGASHFGNSEVLVVERSLIAKDVKNGSLAEIHTFLTSFDPPLATVPRGGKLNRTTQAPTTINAPVWHLLACVVTLWHRRAGALFKGADAMKVVTWQSPAGETINITPAQEERLRAAHQWPHDSQGREYCSVSFGLHDGEPCQICPGCGRVNELADAEGHTDGPREYHADCAGPG